MTNHRMSNQLHADGHTVLTEREVQIRDEQARWLAESATRQMTPTQARLARARLMDWYRAAPDRTPNARDFHPDYAALDRALDRHHATLTAVLAKANALTVIMHRGR